MPRDDEDQRASSIRETYGNSQQARQFWVDVFVAVISRGDQPDFAAPIADASMEQWAARWQ